MAVTLGWYFHLPPCASDVEVAHVVDESLRLLVEAHRQAQCPVSLAITGHLLARMQQRHAGSVQALAAAATQGVVELLATTFYEVCPFLIPPTYLKRQIEIDLALKEEVLGTRPTGFWPGNFAWTPLLANILSDLGVRVAVVDEGHVRQAHQTQLWKWLAAEPMQMGTQLVDTQMADHASGRVYRLERSGGSELYLHVHTPSVRRELSFGTTGAIHHAWDDQLTDDLATRLVASHRGHPDVCTFSGDDGDRINPTSIHQYRRLIRQLRPHLARLRDPDAESAAKALAFLPVYAPGGMEFWRDDVAAAYLHLLDDLYRAVARGSISPDEVLPLQDVFPIFWKRSARTGWFHDRGWEMLTRGTPRAP